MIYKKNKKIYWMFLLVLIVGFSSCTDEEFTSFSQKSGYTLSLTLPQDDFIEIGTRAVNEDKVNDLLAVVIRNGEAEYEYIDIFTQKEGITFATLKDLEPKENDILYVFCNTGRKVIAATDSLSLFKAVSFSNSDSGKNIMFGLKTLTTTGDQSLQLKHAMAKATVSCTAFGYTVKSWKVCNLPSTGDCSYNTYPSGVTFDSSISATDNLAYFVPRKDNSDDANEISGLTCILVNITEKVSSVEVDRGWYRLDFCKQNNADVNGAVKIMNILPNSFYTFNVEKIYGNGYTTEEEAKSNLGSNILYNMEVLDGRYATSNGQYMLSVDKEEIELYPVGGDASGNIEHSVDAITLFAVIPLGASANISTFTVDIECPSGQVKIDGGVGEDGKRKKVTHLSLIGDEPLTASARYDVKLIFDGAAYKDTYLNIRLGNITRKISVKMQLSNCYLFNFKDPGSNEPDTLYIPVAQANLERNRITNDMSLIPVVLWTDQSSLQLWSEYDKVKQWFKVVAKTPFVGNVTIGLKEIAPNSPILWSWHIWSLASDVLFYNSKGYYDFNVSKTNEYNSNTWMDRNLGAYDMTKGKAASRGFVYQWGRKDPFPGGADGLTDDEQMREPDIYGTDGQAFNMSENYPGDNQPCSSYYIPVTGANTLEYTVEYPWRFINALERYGDWYSDDATPKRYDLWLKEDLSKGVYSPCPNGWTMPYGGEFGPFFGLLDIPQDKVTNDGGFQYDGVGFFPLAPTRLTATETSQMMVHASGYSYVWWGNFDKNEKLPSCVTRFHASGFIAQDYCQRGIAYPVRCVKIKEAQ